VDADRDGDEARRAMKIRGHVDSRILLESNILL